MTDARAEALLLDALRGRQGALTRADAVALSGLTVDQAETGLRSLLSRYKSHLAVTEEGELIYRFDPAFRRRDAVSLGERLRRLGNALWRGFTFLFKIWIVVTLVAYVVAFVAMLVALVFARSASDRDDRRRDDGGGFGFPWLLWWMMPDWAPPEVRQKRRAPSGKRFYQSVFDFVFGPPAKRDPLGAEKQVASYLRAVGGRITATDLVALTGWSYERAEEEATRLLADWDGEPEVNEDGTIIYSFPSLRKTAGDEPPGPWLYTWQEKRPVPALTGNTGGANGAIIAMNAFNLVAALAIGPAFLARYGIASPTAETLVTWFPLAFSAIFFAVPAGRAARRARKALALLRASARAALIGEIVARRGAATPPEDLVDKAVARSGVKPELVREELEKLLVDLDGDPRADEAGKLRYAFPRVDEELAAAARARLLASAEEKAPGAVIFASDDEPPPSGPRNLLN